LVYWRNEVAIALVSKSN